jgi:hypothetical protein
MKIEIKIGNVLERTLINHKTHKKDNNFNLKKNINKNRECSGKNSYLA